MSAALRLGVGALLVLLATGCGSAVATRTDRPSGPESSASSGTPGATSTIPGTEAVAMKAPGKLTAPLLSPDVLVFSKDTLPARVVKAIAGVKGVTATEEFSMASFYVEEQAITYAAVNPATFRRFTPAGTAQTTEVWDRVAGGEMAIEQRLGERLQDKDGFLKLGNAKDAPTIHIGAYADGVKRIDAVVNEKWAPRLHMREDNAMLVSTGSTSPQFIQKKLLRISGNDASVQILGVNLDVSVAQTAVLTGGSVASAVGSFNYTVNPNGTVNPDPRWVREYIRTETLPVVGTVRCNKVMLKQLRQVMIEIQERGLASKIYEYGGCYVPRYIAGTNSLSFHTFGTAIDLNVPDNQRGTPGKMDRTVVSIFENWGFTWGGRWHYTDPMHFELARLVKTG